MTQNQVLQKLPLFDEQNKLQPKWINFCGFEMPIQFSEIKNEYQAVRKHTGVFDISHMLPISILSKSEKEVIPFLENLTCRNINQKPQKAQYSVLTDKSGGIIDDIIIYCISSLHYIIIANASNANIVIKHLKNQKPQNSKIKITLYEKYILLAIQGPKSPEAIEKIATKLPEMDLFPVLEKKFYSFHYKKTKQFLSLYSRTGYTGEDGFELLVPKNEGIAIWNILIQMQVTPCGLASRDLLRMEVFYPLHGNELSNKYTPFESNLKWLLEQKQNYLGVEKIEFFQKNPRSQITGFQMNQSAGVPRTGYPICSMDKKQIGTVTSGSFSFQWNSGFGLARIIPNYECSEALIFIRQKFYNITLMKKTPYQGSIQKKSSAT